MSYLYDDPYPTILVDNLIEAASEFAEWDQVLDHRRCHEDICSAGECVQCSKVIALRTALLRIQRETP